MCSAVLLEKALQAAPLPDPMEAVEIGLANLKGIQDPVRIYWLKTP